MPRLYGRGYSHERVNEYVPDVRFGRTSIMGAMGLSGISQSAIMRKTAGIADDRLVELRKQAQAN